jgi:CBS-domain-containing membrane protein
LKNIATKFGKFLGIELSPVSHAERIASAAGGFTAILSVFFISQWSVGAAGAGILVASMGASAVLLFAVPHGQLSQPWPVLGGHIVSAIIGVGCAQAFANEILAASAAVGLAIGCMYYLKCIHPPGGATALSAVVGGEAVRALGYQYVITPVLMNVVIILAVAFLFNYLFPWRRYPASLQAGNKDLGEITPPAGTADISHADFVYALSQVDSFIDAGEDDLLRIYELATQRSHSRHIDANDIVPGGYYSNGKHGDDWSVRQVIDESRSESPEKDILTYKVVAGHGRHGPDCMTRMEFANWAKYRVTRDEENWKRFVQT